MKRKVLVRCFLCAFAAVAVMFTASTLVTYFASRDNIRKNLVSDAELCAAVLRSVGADAFNEPEYFGERRLTVLNAEGEVLFESDAGAKNENHANREEFRAAISGNPKVVERYSETLNNEMFYYAVAVGEGENTIVVRLAAFAGEIGSHVLRSLPFVGIAMLAAIAIAYFMAKKLSLDVTKQVKAVAVSLKSLNEGRYVAVSATMDDREIYAVVMEIDRLFENEAERKRRLTEEEEKLDYVVSHLKEGVVALDKDQRVVLVNDTFVRFFDADRNAPTLAQLLDDNALCERLTALLERGESETFFINEGERDFVVAVETRAEAVSGVKTVVFVSDVTMENLAAKERARFFENASHELKTPLTSIGGLAELLSRRDDLPPQAKKYAQRIDKETKRMAALVTDMLYLSKTETMRRPAASAPVALKPLAEELYESYRAEAERSGIKFSVEGEADAPIDERYAAEILGNLIGNAIHYNKKGGTVAVKLSVTEREITVAVKDTGAGISKEDLPRVTERFYRVDKSRSKDRGGTGLGLAIVKHAAELYGGKLTIESEPGIGTTATVALPLETRTQEDARGAEE